MILSGNHLPVLPSALLNNAQSRAVDRLALAAGVTGLTLMENAGAAIAEVIRQQFTPVETLVLCGPGNNGGDGFVVARLLRQAGWPVRVMLLGKPDSLQGDAAAMAGRWPGDIEPAKADAVAGSALIVDGLFGSGLSRPLAGDAAALVGASVESAAPIVAIDMPSGIDGDSGLPRGAAIKADATVALWRKKPGHLLMPGRRYCGPVRLVDIGIPETVLDDIAVTAWENGPDLWRQALPRPALGGHKYHRGHAVVVSGGPLATGAARLAAYGALRVGAGLVTLACPTEAAPIAAAQVTAVMIAAIDGADDFGRLLDDKRRNAVLLGPGNGIGETTRRRVLASLAADKKVVLDADALTAFSACPETLFTACSGDVVFCPHDGEFRSLFPDIAAAADERGRLWQAREAARQSGAVVILKGADTIIAAADGRAIINAHAPPDLATAGSGDVLAGLIVGLMAQGMVPFEAAAAAVWMHGDAACRFGRGLIAEDLAPLIAAVLADLG